MNTVEKHTTVEFYDKQRDEKFVKEVDNRELDTTPYVHVRKKICEDIGISRSEFEKRYELKNSRRRIRFSDEPWSSLDELESDLKQLDCVKSLYYVSPMEGAYGPPKFNIRSNADTDEILTEVKDYYRGLTVQQDSKGGVSIIVSPIEYSGDDINR